MIGRAPGEYLSAEFTEILRHRVERALAGETVYFELPLESPKKGGTRYFRAIYVPHLDEDGAVLGSPSSARMSPIKGRPRRI